MLREIQSHNVAKNSQALGRVMWQGNVPNSADFVASYKIYTVFYVSGCFKFRVTFHNVLMVLISKLIWNGFVEYQNRKNLWSLLASEHAKLDLFINWVEFNYTLTSKNVTILLFTWTFVTYTFVFLETLYNMILFSQKIKAYVLFLHCSR